MGCFFDASSFCNIMGFMKKYSLIFGIIFLFSASTASAATVKVSGWIPWWQASAGIVSAKKHLSELDTVHPFAFEVDKNGALIEKTSLSGSNWQQFFADARKNNIAIVPTINWSDGAQIHTILSDTTKRNAHIQNIVNMVSNGGYAGVDIDYEQKLAETNPYFSIFLKDLKTALSGKTLSCAIEARTPPADLAKGGLKTPQYANDYAVIGKTCDVVELMAYDQQRIDVTLNTARKGEPYIPVADSAWVEKVLKLAIKEIPTSKLMLAVPTYGREWTLTVAPEWYKAYAPVQTLNMPNIEMLARKYNLTAGKNKAGEMSFSYFPSNSPYSVLNQLATPPGTRQGFEAAAKALLFATYAKTEVPVNIVWYPDPNILMNAKNLAKKYNLRGVSIFKIDGDERVW